MPTARPLLLTVVATALVAVACGSSDAKSSSTSTSASSSTTTTSAPCAGAAWAEVTDTWKANAPGAFAQGRQQVAEDLAALRRGQDTSEVGQVSISEVRTGEPLVVVLSETGVPDVAVTRVDTEITLTAGEQGWVLTSARQRSVCAGGPS